MTDWFGAHLTPLDADLKPLWQLATADRDDDRISIFDAATGALLQ